MAITPHTNLYLLKCPLESDNLNQLKFKNEREQYNYFINLAKLEIEDISYQRKDSIIRYPAHIDSIITYNYVMYQNENYINKWFYAFITNMRYINDEMTEITIKTDVFQTWQHDIVYKESFIEREHTNIDTIGNNTVPENLETGDYIVNTKGGDGHNDAMTVVMASTITPGELNDDYCGEYDGIPSGSLYYRFDDVTSESPNSLKTTINNFGARVDAITSLFMAPKWLAGGDEGGVYIPQDQLAKTFTMEISKLTSLDGYTPKNNKLLTYPYCYILMTNSAGTSAIYRQEVWNTNSNRKVEFKVEGCLTPGCSIYGYPKNYNGTETPKNEGLSLGKFPQLNWVTDTYTNWLTQNGVNIGLGITGSAITTGVGIATGNPIGIASGILGIGQSVGQIYQHSFEPPQAKGNLNSGDVTTATRNNQFIYYGMSVKNQFARIIDNYFSMYGYKTNRLKLPNITGRKNWNFVKTIGCNIEGNIPQSDIEEIKSMFNKGITLWHNPSTYLDYSQSNSIV